MNANNADVTPDLSRAIWIRGEIDKSMLAHLEPQIQDLTTEAAIR